MVIMKFGKRNQPWLSLIWAGEVADVQAHVGQVGAVACWSSVRAVTPSGSQMDPSPAVYSFDEFGESRDHPATVPGRSRAVRGTPTCFGAGPDHPGRGHGDAVVPWKLKGGLRLDVEHRRSCGCTPADVVALVEGVHDDLPVAVQRLLTFITVDISSRW